ncbi:hypothetical protein [Nocardia alni]|uniref:hypothetical protein n=1 Tax=Nocardia alni TaxID=2815723 RepID=UPI001C22542A
MSQFREMSLDADCPPQYSRQFKSMCVVWGSLFGRTQGVVIARVIEVAPHPNAERIRLAIIDLGDGFKRQVVYGGARELCPGDLVPAAPPGARVPGKKKMRKRNYRGQSSHGMLCSSDELGWTSCGPDEVALLDQNLQIGQTLDHVFDLLSLRSDVLMAYRCKGVGCATERLETCSGVLGSGPDPRVRAVQ